jgi:hypothetical protein
VDGTVKRMRVDRKSRPSVEMSAGKHACEWEERFRRVRKMEKEGRLAAEIRDMWAEKAR